MIDPTKAREGEPACDRCGRYLMFSARQRGNGLCGPCDRLSKGKGTPADLIRDERFASPN